MSIKYRYLKGVVLLPKKKNQVILLKYCKLFF